MSYYYIESGILAPSFIVQVQKAKSYLIRTFMTFFITRYKMKKKINLCKKLGNKLRDAIKCSLFYVYFVSKCYLLFFFL